MREAEDHSTLNLKSWKEHLWELESSICEGLDYPLYLDNRYNIFGRTVLQSNESNLSYLSGLAYSGLRVSAILSPRKLREVWLQIQTANRQLLPITINIDNCNHSHSRELHHPELLDLESIQIVSSNSQEILDFATISHQISETALIPTIHQISTSSNGEIELLTNRQLMEFLGNPDDRIKSPTPSQTMLFGVERRRIPQWISLDTPMLLGAKKDLGSLWREEVAKEVYFKNHLNDIISTGFNKFREITGRNYDFISSYNVDKSSHLIITVGHDIQSASYVINELQHHGTKIGLVNINVINPFPSDQLKDLLSGKKVVTVLEPIGKSQNFLESKVRECISTVKNAPKILIGKSNYYLKVKDLIAVCDNMTSKEPKSHFYCDVDFITDQSRYPKYQVIVEEVKRNYPRLKDKSLPTIPSDVPRLNRKDFNNHIFGHVTRQYKNAGPPYVNLSQFNDNNAIFFNDEEVQEMTVEPFKSVSSIPAASSSLFSANAKRNKIPEIFSDRCTACGECLVQCPYSALPSLAINLENLLKAGVDLARKAGTKITVLIPMVKNISRSMGKLINSKASEGQPLKLTEILTPAFNDVASQMKLESEKLESAKREITSISEVLQDIPINLSDILYHIPEAQKKGTGELFFLTVDPNSCTGCGLCEEVCPEDAIEMVSEGEEHVSELYSKMNLWENLPDTSAETINRLLYDKDYNSFAALLLSRNFYFSQIGGDFKSNGINNRQLVHLVSTQIESLVQPRYNKFVSTLDNLIQDLSDNIHSLLSSSLPSKNFQNIAKAIESTSSNKVPFDEIISNISKEDRLRLVDANEIKRKIELLQSLEGLKWSLCDGATGVGRSRSMINLVDSPEFTWASTYPFNPFISPAFVWDSEFSGALTSGFFDGQIRNLVDNLKLIRKANLEAKNKYQPKEHDQEIADLNWDHLTDEEKSFIPPILIIIDNRSLSRNEILTFIDECLSNSDKPIKILLLEDSIPSPVQSYDKNEFASVLVPIINQKNAYIFQGGTSDFQILFDGLIQGLNTDSPALFRVHSPNPDRHIELGHTHPILGNLALRTRAFPNIRFNPENNNGFISDSIKLDDNPDLENSWITESIEYGKGNNKNTLEFELTWADWAYTLKDWQPHFEEYTEEDAVHISNFISSPTGSGTPVIYRIKDDAIVKYKVSQSVVNQTKKVKEAWDLLRELSGNLTPFPEKLKKQVKHELKAEYDQEIARIKDEFEEKLKILERKQLEDIKNKLRDKLIELTTKKNIDGNN